MSACLCASTSLSCPRLFCGSCEAGLAVWTRELTELGSLNTDGEAPPKPENVRWVSLDFKTTLTWTATPSDHTFTVLYSW